MASPEAKEIIVSVAELKYKNHDVYAELCGILDLGDRWKTLAGKHMQYKPIDIIQMEAEAKRDQKTPADVLLTKWGHLNHKVSELFVLCYQMGNLAALRCLERVTDQKFLRLIQRLERKIEPQIDNNRVIIKLEPENNRVNQPIQHQPNVGFGIRPEAESSTRAQGNSSGSVSSLLRQNNDVNRELDKVAAIPTISYKELKEATDNWNENNLLGKGGFGSVYKGTWKHTLVAVKKLRVDDGRFKELIREMCVNQCRHDNILPLYGYSIGGTEACLVYQLMVGGSLEHRLKSQTLRPLTWPERYRIAHGVARGLQFLHSLQPALVHGDVKPANILLDGCLAPRIGDFGLARRHRPDHPVSKVYGTFAYLPLDYLTTLAVKPAVDVYSFGLLLLETATTVPAFDKARKVQRLNDLMRFFVHQNTHPIAILEDGRLRNTPESNPYLCEKFILIGVECTKDKAEHRPPMLDVFKMIDDLNLPTVPELP